MNIHFIFGLANDFNEKPFIYFHYLCLKSCYLTQKNCKINIHCIYEPQNNIWWDKIKMFCNIVKYTSLPDVVYNCNNKNVWRVEHQSDIFRLLILQEHGGIYADIDTIFYKEFPHTFFDKEFLIGTEYCYKHGKQLFKSGLCNALIICKPNSKFLNIWIDEYKTNYDDQDWNKLSVRTPETLSDIHKDLIHIEPVESFHKYGWDETIYTDGSDMNTLGIYSKHVAESKLYDLLSTIDDKNILTDYGFFSKLCLQINGLLNERHF